MSKVRVVIELCKDDEWETPPELLKDACKRYKIFPTLDVCCTNYNYKCDYWFTKQDYSLVKDWTKDFFMNPPYSQVEQWITKAYYEYKKHNVTGLALVYSKTDTKWWHYKDNPNHNHFWQ